MSFKRDQRHLHLKRLLTLASVASSFQSYTVIAKIVQGIGSVQSLSVQTLCFPCPFIAPSSRRSIVWLNCVCCSLKLAKEDYKEPTREEDTRFFHQSTNYAICAQSLFSDFFFVETAVIGRVRLSNRSRIPRRN